MLALRKVEPAPGVALVEIDGPEPGAGEVLIEVAAAGICGSDLHIDHWTSSYGFIAPSIPVTLGHEVAGRVVALGEHVETLTAGQAVVVMPSVTCGSCHHCHRGDFDLCTTRSGIGMTRDGGFACFLLAPERNCVPVPAGLNPAIAALAEPLTVAKQAVDRGGARPGDRILVLGPGTIGQGIALMARRAGAAEIVLCGRADAPRLATAAALGFDGRFDLAEPDAATALLHHAGSGFDIVFEATGNPSAIQFGLDRLRVGGAMVIAGVHDTCASIDATMLVRRQLEMRGSYRAPLATWRTVVEAIAEAPATFAPMVTHQMPLTEGLEAFGLAHAKAGSKIVLLPQA